MKRTITGLLLASAVVLGGLAAGGTAAAATVTDSGGDVEWLATAQQLVGPGGVDPEWLGPDVERDWLTGTDGAPGNEWLTGTDGDDWSWLAGSGDQWEW